jgi:hypothetical protein
VTLVETLKSFDITTVLQMLFTTVLLFGVWRIFMKDKKAWKILKFGYPAVIILMLGLMTSIVLVKYV